MSANTTEASRYQQLRGHLAYLKLATAAEALPAVLDTAKTENLSPTATLERLLRIEVQATEARRLERRIRFSNLPTAATIEDFDFDAQPGVDPDLIRDLASNRYLETGTNILIIGPARRGEDDARDRSRPQGRRGRAPHVLHQRRRPRRPLPPGRAGGQVGHDHAVLRRTGVPGH